MTWLIHESFSQHAAARRFINFDLFPKIYFTIFLLGSLHRILNILILNNNNNTILPCLENLSHNSLSLYWVGKPPTQIIRSLLSNSLLLLILSGVTFLREFLFPFGDPPHRLNPSGFVHSKSPPRRSQGTTGALSWLERERSGWEGPNKRMFRS